VVSSWATGWPCKSSFDPKGKDVALFFDWQISADAVHFAGGARRGSGRAVRAVGGSRRRRWSKLRADETVIARAIVDREVAGTIGSWGDSAEREITYWIGRAYWGKGIATGALNAFLTVDPSRPLHARVASDNVASRRVLEKCGFRVIAKTGSAG
jgi:RimJ/RimL family protein N-acetyltransferase